MKQTVWIIGIVVTSVWLCADAAWAGSPRATQRFSQFTDYVCEGGPNAGQTCTPGVGQCPSGTCSVAFQSNPGLFTATVTMIVDDNTSVFVSESDENAGLTPDAYDGIVAATVMLETFVFQQSVNTRYVFAQTYQNVRTQLDPDVSCDDTDDLSILLCNLQNGPFLGDSRFRGTGPNPTDERRLIGAVKGDDDALLERNELIENLLFQEGDSEIAQALRNLFGVAQGRPFVQDVPQISIGPGQVDDRSGADGLASVVRFRNVKIGFTP